eukprot:TRINITY_DN73715_c0_g1_i1.p1 TRINITY_DN73715_c0_g1~~TRINITY_DN73715_c0_g1_i1.p1  ORF type:complete len:433 (-),score=101.39 TRINITY_DN73715_c0_g1_i1:87-1313(-)
MEAALHDAMQNFAAKQFLRSVEGKLTVQEQLDRTERPKEVSSFGHEQAAIPEHRRQRALPGMDCPGPHLGVLNPFTDAALQQAAVEEQRLSAIPGQAWVYTRQPDKEKKPTQGMEAFCTEVRDDGDQASSVLPLQHRQGTQEEQLRPSLACCLVSRAAALGGLAVGAGPGEKVLDLCPGSGAKALVLATALFAAPGPATEGLPWLQSVGQETGALGGYCNSDAGGRTHPSTSLLVCNEPSRQRAQRLEALLGSFLPSEVPITSVSAGKQAHSSIAGRVVITKVEGTDKPSLLPLQRLGPFDKVLVDPSCRPEREGKASEVAEALLRSAAQLVRPGGRIIFCGTAAEAELVVQRFMRKVGQDFEVVPPGPLAAPIAQAFTCEFGTMVPAGPASSGHGPLYVAQLRREGK